MCVPACVWVCAGITRETLRKYERAITTDPQFFGDKKGGLINDFNK